MSAINPFYIGLGNYSATITNTTATLTVPDTAALGVFSVSAQPIRETMDGTVPVAAMTGTYRAANTVWEIYGYANLLNWKGIRDGGTDGRLNVQFFKALV